VDPDAESDTDYYLIRIRIRIIIWSDPDQSLQLDADRNPDLDPSFQIKSKDLEKVKKYDQILHILACHLQIDSDPVPDQAYHFDADRIFIFDADPDFQFMHMRIRVPKIIRIRIHNTRLRYQNPHSEGHTL
jgi:hypothetical protein